ncbi:MAG: class I SAM-dependent methyltransferase [Gemmatimonadota bacterium]|jgi:demethylmenaquinone methyltransferase/2-methoxy-6-polyprenyl-1,4-benzoquinol methylase
MVSGRNRYRARYYDAFSRVYDRFVALHSRDTSGRLRDLLVERASLPPGGRALDLCTGTGALLPGLTRRAGDTGSVVGLDFSRGMLGRARLKSRGHPGVALVQADASQLPFSTCAFDVVTCSHAFYELRGDGAEEALCEVGRALRPGGCFLMMEHEVPANPLVRVLFRLRLLSMGLRRAREILDDEEGLFRRHFRSVQRLSTADGRSKIFICGDPT